MEQVHSQNHQLGKALTPMNNFERWSLRLQVVTVIIAVLTLGAMIWIAKDVTRIAQMPTRCNVKVYYESSQVIGYPNEWKCVLTLVNDGPGTPGPFRLSFSTLRQIGNVSISSAEVTISQYRREIRDAGLSNIFYWVEGFAPTYSIEFEAILLLNDEQNADCVKLLNSQDGAYSFDLAKRLVPIAYALSDNVNVEWVASGVKGNFIESR